MSGGIWLHGLFLSTHENFGAVFGNDERCGALRITGEGREDRRIAVKVLSQSPHPMRIVGMIREQLRHMRRVGLIEVLKQPDQTPGVVVARGADISTGQISRR